jgi:hypothetical protein
MRYKLIACGTFRRELEAAIPASPGAVDPEFLELGLHERPSALRSLLQERVDAAGGSYDAILLGYGLCGNAVAGLRARASPLVLPRAHDCCTILLGSRAAFLRSFGDCLSASWSSAGYVEGGRREEEPPGRALRYIETPETAGLGYAGLLREKAAEEGREFLLLRGSSRLLRALLAGGWDEEEFLLVPPGGTIVGIYDQDRVVAAERGRIPSTDGSAKPGYTGAISK